MRHWAVFLLGLLSFSLFASFACADTLPAYRQAPVLRYQAPGQFQVRLVGLPGTGYRWHFVAARSPDLALLSAHAVPLRGAKGRLGGPEARLFSFRFKPGVRPYPVALQFVYSRPFEENEPVAKQVVWAYLAD